MSNLTVGSLSGLSSNGFVIGVEPGSKIVQPGAVLQVVSATNNTNFATTSTTYTGYTNMSVTLTPTSTSSKVLLFTSFTAFNSSGNGTGGTIYAGGVSISAPDWEQAGTGSGTFGVPVAISFLHSPSTTSATTYQVFVRAQTSGTANFNKGTITAMEIAG
jgi:hypothetical protein